MKINWFLEGAALKGKELKAIEKWISEHSDEIHEILHIVQEYEMEAFKIIHGSQEMMKSGISKINSIELFFIPNLVLVVYSEEVHEAKGGKLTRKLNYLGSLEIPCDDEEER